MTWSEIVLAALKDNGVRFAAFVPDNILTPLIASVMADRDFVSVGPTREDEAVAAATLNSITTLLARISSPGALLASNPIRPIPESSPRSLPT